MIPVGFPPSRRARELAHDLFRVVREFRALHPDMTDAEIRHALRIIEMEAGGNYTRNVMIALYIVTLLLLAGVFYLLLGSE
ncbi:MAG: hypothetical protein FJY97_06335 [candidate division Zixibacteria bacterium]|nr:hypothetical protein [candidate division Zixibacteria bacterium]